MVQPLVLHIQVWTVLRRVLTDLAEKGLLCHDHLWCLGLSLSIYIKWQNQNAFDDCTTGTKIGVGDQERCKEIVTKEMLEELEANMTIEGCELRPT